MISLPAGSRRAPLPILVALVGVALCAPEAHAGKLVLSPLLTDASVDAKQRLAVHQLISSELEFSPEVEGVVDLSAAPPTLNDACLANPKCLQGIASSNGGQQAIAGKLSVAGSNFVMDLVYFDGQTVARRKAFTVPQDPTSLANAMTPIVRELLSGGSPQTAAATSASSTDFALEEEDDFGSKPAGAALPIAAAAPLGAGAPTPSVPAGQDRRLAAASAATGFAVGSAAPAPTGDEEALAKSISFGGSASDISAEEINAISFSPPPGLASSAPPPRPVPVSTSSINREILDEEEEDLDGSASLDDERKPPPRGGGSSKGGSSKGGSPGLFGAETDHIGQITARGGYSRYYSFDFVTGGGEAAIALAQGFHVIAGAEVYAVERVLPPELQLRTGIFSQWNYIFPGNIGAMYKFPLGLAEPYVGADTIFVQYYKDKVGADWAIGGRLRGGVDFMVHENFGFNLNLAVGGWSGQNWSIIEQGVGRAGFLPQFSGGTLVSF